METVYLGKWDNYPTDHPKRLEQLQQVIDKVEDVGEVRVSFDYIGFTKELQVGKKMLSILEELGYNGTVGYRQSLVVRK